MIEADSARAVWVPDPRLAQLIQPGAAAAVIFNGLARGDRNITFAVCLWRKIIRDRVRPLAAFSHVLER